MWPNRYFDEEGASRCRQKPPEALQRTLFANMTHGDVKETEVAYTGSETAHDGEVVKWQFE